ncbi:MAG TPA: hypothetical protein VGP72_05250 [Planctomycetota bacterium]|jgi:hypothetical protein
MRSTKTDFLAEAENERLTGFDDKQRTAGRSGAVQFIKETLHMDLARFWRVTRGKEIIPGPAPQVQGVLF